MNQETKVSSDSSDTPQVTPQNGSLLEKFMSGRFLLTLAVATVFVFSACTGLMEPKDVLLIVSQVITFYFMKKRQE